jgi:hypothetical protein
VSISVNIHPEGFRAQSDPTRSTVWLNVQAGSGPAGSSDAAIFLTSRLCDELIEAATAAKQLLAAGEAEAK